MATITVSSKEQAWAEVNKIFPTDYEKDEGSSLRAGYDIYRHHSLNYYSRICDLGSRLEVLTGENGENVTNILIEPEIIPGMGTNLAEADYAKLAGGNGTWELTEAEAIIRVNHEFGFEASRVKIITDADIFYKDGNCARLHKRYERSPQYCATDYNYIRFDVNGWQYEMVDGALKPYYN